MADMQINLPEVERKMGHLSEIAKELYDDGVKEGKSDCIKRILSKRLSEFPNENWKRQLDETSLEKLDRISDEVFRIKSWDDVEKILDE